jgi:hypothetical protein
MSGSRQTEAAAGRYHFIWIRGAGICLSSHVASVPGRSLHSGHSVRTVLKMYMYPMILHQKPVSLALALTLTLTLTLMLTLKADYRR